MTQVKDAIAAVCEFARQPIVAPLDDEAHLLQDESFRHLLQLCHAPGPARNEALAGLAPVILSVADDFQASRVAMTCGILVEWGADPGVAISAILDRLTNLLTRSISPADADAAMTRSGMRYLIMAAMTMLCLDVHLRIQARRRAHLMDAVRETAPRSREVKFLERLFNLADGDELIVLHPLAQRGFRVQLEAIASNFHLFTLLQAAIVGDPDAGLLDGPRASRMVIGTATGEIPHDRLVTDSAVFHYATWQALQPDGTLNAASETWIFGEPSPRAIPDFEGERVVLLGPQAPASRSWDSSYFSNLHDVLRSKVDLIETLSTGEVALRLGRILNALRRS